jgi:hypothetical protein
MSVKWLKCRYDGGRGPAVPCGESRVVCQYPFNRPAPTFPTWNTGERCYIAGDGLQRAKTAANPEATPRKAVASTANEGAVDEASPFLSAD